MNAQQLHDLIIYPALEYIGSRYNAAEARFLLLGTAAIESECGHFIKQFEGPALGVWQMEPKTHDDIINNCDAIPSLSAWLDDLKVSSTSCDHEQIIRSPMYACVMARLKYAMDSEPLPTYTADKEQNNKAFYAYYKRIYNTELGASTYEKWVEKLGLNRVHHVNLSGNI